MKFGWTVVAVAIGALLGGCNKGPEVRGASGTTVPVESMQGTITVDGSSTVFPIMERAAEDFGKVSPGVRIPVGTSGTGGGFKKFSAGEIDISDASRPIEAEEIELCQKNGVEFVELPIAFDGISVVVNPKNTWAANLTVEELKKIWEPNSKVKLWSDVRPTFPMDPITLYGAGTDSGTFDYFTKAIVGEEKSSRSDYMASEDDNVLVSGVAGDKNAMGYFGFAYFDKNRDTLKALGIDDGKGVIDPTPESIGNGTYQPLSRPLFIYINRKALERPEVMAFAKFILANLKYTLPDVGYVALPEGAYALALARLEAKQTGSIFSGKELGGVKIDEFMKKESGATK